MLGIFFARESPKGHQYELDMDFETMLPRQLPGHVSSRVVFIQCKFSDIWLV